MPAQRVAKSRRTSEEARQEIIDLARAFLSKRPFRELDIGGLMAGAQIGRSAFYAYFDDIYDLLEELVHDVAEDVQAAASEWIVGDVGGPDVLRPALESMLDTWVRHGRLIVAFQQAAGLDARLEKIWARELRSGSDSRVARAIRRDQKAGLIGAIDAFETAVALNRFNIGYLGERIGCRGRITRRKAVLDTLERVWMGTLYGRVPKRRRL